MKCVGAKASLFTTITNSPVFNPRSKVLVLGGQGMVGSAIIRALSRAGFKDIAAPDRRQLDLLEAAAVRDYFEDTKPEYVFMAAAKVGGIMANATQPAEFLQQNLAIALNTINAAHLAGVQKLLFLGSTCIYPRLAAQPLREDALLSGPLEPTNEWYAIAKIAGIKLCQAYRKQWNCDFIAAMPTNLYGPGDNYDLETSHVLPALIRRFHEAKSAQAAQVILWGTGQALREFLHVDDCAEACVHLMHTHSSSDIVNIGVGRDISIRQLATLVADVVGYSGDIQFDATKPDGTPRKLVDVSRIHATGWQAKIALLDGISATYDAYRESLEL